MTAENTPTPPSEDGVSPISIVEEMKTSYLDYAMSVIVSRALPDVRDGLKPVHRRILYACQEGGYRRRPALPQVAPSIVGDVMGKYHPHGDSAIYDALARMAQDWSMRVPLIDGQGNFGSMDPDPPAAMRYTEARLAKVADDSCSTISTRTRSISRPITTARESEPQVLPARFPNLLVNGAGGIAVGMATNIPPHNLGEVIAACRAYMDDPAITIEELMEIVPGPDFPTGAADPRPAPASRSAYHTGRGSIIMRARHMIEEGRGDRRSIVLTAIPYQVGKNGPGREDRRGRQGQADRGRLRHSRRIEPRGRAHRHRPEARRDPRSRAQPAVAAHPGAVELPGQHAGDPRRPARDADPARHHRELRQFREEVITRRSKFELAKARDRAHILLGLVVAVTNLDEVVQIIRGSASPAEARAALLAREWPIAEIAPYIALVEAVETEIEPATPITCPKRRSARSSSCASTA